MFRSVPMEFKKVPNDEKLLSSGQWRLACVQEVKSNLGKIKAILEQWSIVRLSDGWVTGPGYNYELKQGCRSGLGEMLVVKTDRGRFKMLSRDSHLIAGQWRLASVEEVRRNLEEVKAILKEWSIVRLLDGWVTGPGYKYELQQGHKSGMSDMLVVETNRIRPSDDQFDSEMYSGLELTAQGRQAALLLSADDKITEVIHLVLHLFAKDAQRLAETEGLILKVRQLLGCNG